MAAFVNSNRMVLLGAAWTGTAPGVGVTTISGTIATPSDISVYVHGGGEPGYNANMVDATTYGSLGYSVVLPGITSSDDIVLDANSDFAASALRSIITTTLGGVARPGSAPIYVDIKPTNAARSATNPSFVAACYIKAYKPFQGNVGDRATTQLTLTVVGTFGDLTS